MRFQPPDAQWPVALMLTKKYLKFTEDFVFVKENFDENSERLSFISEEDKGSLRSAG